MSDDPATELCGLLVHWHDETGAARVIEDWGEDSRFQLLIIDNGSSQELAPKDSHILLQPGRNLGFAGAINMGLRHTQAPLILILNTDCRPHPGALEQILDGFARHPEAAALVPQLFGRDGQSQHRWQLRPLPSLAQLMLQAMMVPIWSGPRDAPPAGSPIEQPAAAALAIRREVLLAVGGFDERFHPAWFEDVDLATRLKDAGELLLYWPASQFEHGLGQSVDSLGYARFLWLHYRNLYRFLLKHHGRFWAETSRLGIVAASLIRLILLPLRKPVRAPSRRRAAKGLLSLAKGAVSRWRWPAEYLQDPDPIAFDPGDDS